MNYKLASIAFALTGVLALGGVGCSDSPGNQQQQPSPNARAEMPPTPPYTAGQPRLTGGTGQPGLNASTGLYGSIGHPGTNGSAGPVHGNPAFDEIAGNKGYVTQQDAQHDPWLAQHFSQCDANGDGKVTRQEYSQCRQGPSQNTMSSPPRPSPSGSALSLN